MPQAGFNCTSLRMKVHKPPPRKQSRKLRYFQFSWYLGSLFEANNKSKAYRTSNALCGWPGSVALSLLLSVLNIVTLWSFASAWSQYCWPIIGVATGNWETLFDSLRDFSHGNGMGMGRLAGCASPTKWEDYGGNLPRIPKRPNVVFTSIVNPTAASPPLEVCCLLNVKIMAAWPSLQPQIIHGSVVKTAVSSSGQENDQCLA